MKKINKTNIFVAAIMAVTIFTSCEDRLGVTDNMFSPKVKSLNVHDVYNMYQSGEYDHYFEQFSYALSMIFRDNHDFKEFMAQELLYKTRVILLRELLDEESELGQYIRDALSLYVDVDFFLEYFPDMRIDLVRNNIDELRWRHAVGNFNNTAVVYKSYEYLQKLSDVLTGYIDGDTPVQIDNIAFHNGFLFTIGYNVLPILNYNATFEYVAEAVSEMLRHEPEFRFVLHEKIMEGFEKEYNTFEGEYNAFEKEYNAFEEEYNAFDWEPSVLIWHLIYRSPYKDYIQSLFEQYLEIPIFHIVEDYPLIQIAMPLFAKEWDPNNWDSSSCDPWSTPPVIYLPYDLEDDDDIIFHLPNVDECGYYISSTIEPDFPVVVISENERLTIEEVINPNPPAPTIPAPTNLTVNSPTIQNPQLGIHLSWQRVAGVSGYEVWIKTPRDGDFRPYRTVNGSANTTFQDKAYYQPGNIIDYKVRAYVGWGLFGKNTMGLFSDFSNIVNVIAPNMPNAPLTFTANQTTANQVELNWTLPQSQAIDKLLIYRQIVGNGGYQRIGEKNMNIPSVENFYMMDRNFAPGQIIKYQLYIQSPTGALSNPKDDFIISTYRDPSKLSPVRIKAIEYNNTWANRRALTSWFRGRGPEFSLKVLSVSKDNRSTPVEVQREIKFTFPNTQYFPHVKRLNENRLVLNWQPGYFYDMLTFHCIATKRTKETSVELSASFNLKELINDNKLNVASTPTVKLTYSNKTIEIGYAYYSYYEPMINHWLEFPNYGVRILISNQ